MLRRTPLRRTPFRRRPRERRARLERPGVTPSMPPGWRALCRTIRARDGDTCRRCGVVVLSGPGPVDHVIPRRLFPDGASASAPENLAHLCEPCHGVKTGRIEPALYRGDVQAFEAHLLILARSGPIPPGPTIQAAYGRLASLLNP